MSSPPKSPTPSPKSSPRLKHLPVPPLPHTSSSDSSSSSSSTVKTSSPLNPSVSPRRTAPLSSSPEDGGMQYRLRVNSTGSTVRNPSPSQFDAVPRIFSTSSPQRGRSRSPHRGRVASPSSGSDSHTPELGDSWWGSREILARPWHEPLKRKKTIPPEHTERWEITRKVCNPRWWLHPFVKPFVSAGRVCCGFSTRYSGCYYPRAFANRCRLPRFRSRTRAAARRARAPPDMGYLAASRRECPSCFSNHFPLTCGFVDEPLSVSPPHGPMCRHPAIHS